MKAALLVLSLVVVCSIAALRDQFAAGRGGQDPAPLFKVIEAPLRQRPFTSDAVSRITETTLKKAGSNRYFATFMSAGSAKVSVQHVELRLPTPANSKKDGILILSIDPAAHITTAAVEQRFGSRPSLSVPEPAAPYEFAYTYPQPCGRLSFEFARGTRYLVAAILDATEPPPAASRPQFQIMRNSSCAGA